MQSCFFISLLSFFLARQMARGQKKQQEQQQNPEHPAMMAKIKIPSVLVPLSIVSELGGDGVVPGGDGVVTEGSTGLQTALNILPTAYLPGEVVVHRIKSPAQYAEQPLQISIEV